MNEFKPSGLRFGAFGAALRAKRRHYDELLEVGDLDDAHVGLRLRPADVAVCREAEALALEVFDQGFGEIDPMRSDLNQVFFFALIVIFGRWLFPFELLSRGLDLFFIFFIGFRV